MIKTLNFKVDVFGASVKVVFSNESEKERIKRLKKVEKQHGEEHNDSSDYNGACFSPDDNIYQYYMFFNIPELTHGLIAHECEHLKNYILERFAYNIKSGDEEVPPNLSELIHTKIYTFIHDKGLKVGI